MNISGIRPYSGFYDYNSIQSIGNTTGLNAPGLEVKPTQQSDEQAVSPQAERDYAAQSFGAADYAKQYQPEATYEMKGSDSDIRSLDVEQALSDMQKDQVLQQYQFFVGESNGQSSIGAMADMNASSVRATENFSL